MPTDWTKPFPRDALFISYPNSEKPLLVRPKTLAGTPIGSSTYAELEEQRQAWYADEVLRTRSATEDRNREKRAMQERRMVREGMEENAHRALKKLAKWKPWVDTERWQQLEDWLESHPQRWSELDAGLSLVDNADWKDPFAGVPVKPTIAEQLKPRRGRPRGTPNSPASNTRRSETAKKRWEERKARGWVDPRLRDRPARKEPY